MESILAVARTRVAVFPGAMTLQERTGIGWDDLRVVLALARAGSFAGAARELGWAHSSVLRRLAAIEMQGAVRLFDRVDGRLVPTEAGRGAATAAERMEIEAASALRLVAGADAKLSGRLRVTASETMSFRILPGLVARFLATHPGIEIELLVDNRALDLARREADVALRAARPEAPALFGRKLADIDWALYGAPNAPDRLIGWTEAAGPLAPRRWNDRHPGARPFRADSLLSQFQAAREGIGSALLPCYLAEGEPGLQRLGSVVSEVRTELWVVTHEDLARTARIRAFMEHAAQELGEVMAAVSARLA